MKTENLVAGVFTVIFGIYVFWTSTGFGLQGLSPDPLGPAFFPKSLGTGLIVLGLVLFGRAVKQKDNQKRTEPLLSGGNKKILAVIGLGFLYVLFMEKIGFILATILFILAVMAVTGERNWRTVVISSLGVSLVLYLLFKEVLQVMLPTGFGL